MTRYRELSELGDLMCGEQSRSLLVMLNFCTVILLFACGGTTQMSELDLQNTKCDGLRAYSDQDYLTERGVGHTIAEARDRASAELTRRLSAELNSEVSVKTVEGSHGGQADEVQESIRVSSRFRHAELIRPIKKCERCEGTACVSFIYLGRDELATRLLKSISPELKRITEALKDLKADSDLLRFTQAWYISQAAAKKIEPISEQLKIIGRSSPELESAEKGIEHARKERAKREERLWVIVDRPQITSDDPLPSTLSEGVSGRLSKALEILGLKQSTESTCPQSSPKADYLKVTPKGTLSCTLGLIGPQCRLALSVHLQLCGIGKLGEDSWSQVKLIGVHTRDRRGAIEALLKNIGKVELSAPLSKSLSPFVIL